MENEKLGLFILKLIFYSAAVGFLAGILELYIGHRFILDPLLYDKDLGFVYESYLTPTYYGFTKSIVVAIVFFLVYLLTFRKNIKSVLKSIIIGILGTAIFGIYYYLTFPRSTFFGGAIIGIVHFLFISGTCFIFTKIAKLK
ncbi:MAG: hypothetical protein A3J62_02530 [Candidatus Buchananbacteria bacterium RIFCSPHIGHO2_02_FULL_38_8]|uniref:Uncharacterized protein n=2 Tax=Candidatus Buchananiibacteriota TaxID=1817903 RepID=A0A1G1Y0H1_9BACT|nr:MAG: hypothetical protein A2731_00835 [Candidatus Buchananbacteria bacterium RIFCSPHIGHO2_01_FULL_39_8]OGY47994.1 MAG: hypothetical protein A3J62_02530 [Candidatus Buchananbacteria bacterium RIFCSPHIGHO2_02_FULL_38_8]